MTTSIAEFYINELETWEDVIQFRLDDFVETEDWLQEIIQLDTIPMLAATTEHYLNQIHLTKQHYLLLQQTMKLLKKKLFGDDLPIQNEEVTNELENQQKELRTGMHQLEKKYLDLKYNCDAFLAETISKQLKNKKDDITGDH